MKRLVIATLATLATACGSKPPSEPTPPPSSSKSARPALPSAPDVTRFFTADVTGALRADANNSPIVSYLASLLQPPPACWTTLTGAIRASYQLEVAGHGSYFLFDGELPRAEVERCITTALGDALDVHVTH
ncbi:MAG: hypothetical protein NT062_05790, partial [Proteobacteria bacterium]|nr:hypothetical protein [Pseudomonadota bacterium]